MRRNILVIIFVMTFILSNLTVLADELSQTEMEGTNNQVMVAIGDDMYLMNKEDYENMPEKYSLLPPLKDLTLRFTGTQKIPTTSFNGAAISSGGEVIYRLKFEVKATLMTGKPANNYPVVSYTPSTTYVVGMRTVNTNSSGIGYIEVDVRGSHKFDIEARCEGKKAGTSHTPALRSTYESPFLISGYIVAYENDYSKTGMITPSGLNEQYPSTALHK